MFVRIWGKRFVAGLIIVGLGLTMGLVGAPPAAAAGVTTHSWMAVAAIPRVSDPDLRALLQANHAQVEGGAHFPDSGYANPAATPPIFETYGEDAHWPRFSNAYADQIRDDPRCGDLTEPTGPCAARIAHMMGAVGHGIGDEVWDWLFEPQAPDHGESYIPPALAGAFGTGGIEFQMDVIAIRDYGRPTSPDLPPWPKKPRLLGVFASIGRTDIDAADLTNGEISMIVARGGERFLANSDDTTFNPAVPNHTLMTENMPWTSAHMVTAPGGVRFASRAIAANWDSLWGRLLGDQPRTEVAVTYPAAGEAEVPTTGWDRASFQPGSAANRGGARNRITAVLSSSVPYLPGPGDQPELLPTDAMTLTKADSGAPVAIRGGYPRVVPYGSEAGEHTIDIQPDTNLDPCTVYRVRVTNALLDENNEPVRPMSWTFTTDGCPGTVTRPDAQARVGTSGAFVGADVHNATGAGQSRTITTPRGTTAEFNVQFDNDGNATDQFTVTGQPAATGFKVQYFNGPTDVTSAVKAGTYQTVALAPGDSAMLRAVITIKANASPLATLSRRVTATSGTDPSSVDTVKLVVEEGPSPEAADAAALAEATEVVGTELTPELLSTMASALICALPEPTT